MLPNETIGNGAPSTCPDCQLKLVNAVHRSGAGFYIGTFCNCGPYSRESGYFATKEEAQAALESGNYGR
jgi:non-ribosomal peptide synthetase component E (peptide arylation enzyme)